jgi:hypothetical protein
MPAKIPVMQYAFTLTQWILIPRLSAISSLELMARN